MIGTAGEKLWEPNYIYCLQTPGEKYLAWCNPTFGHFAPFRY